MSRPLQLALGALVVVAVTGTGHLALRWQVPAPAPVAPPAQVVAEAEGPAPPPAADRLQSIQLRRGDTMVSALLRAGFSARSAHLVAQLLGKGGAELKRLRPGNRVDVTWSPSGEATAVTWQSTPWLGWTAVAGEEGWSVRRLETTPDVRVEALQGEVRHSLFQAVDDIGETPQLVLAVVGIFESDFDFTADTRAGDRFRLLVEKRYAGETFVSYGRVLAAQYASDGRMMTGIGTTRRGSERFDYYDPKGQSLRKSFLKSPLEFSRITSGFTYARPHPILGGSMPHLAVDYAAPVGTPVRAVADGTVFHAGWDGGYGITVRIRHRSGYETTYAHLSRLASGIRAGTRVTQRHVIGYVGSTGMSTGPHLHYEVAKGGRRVNPLSEKFIPGDPIAAAERGEFVRHARQLLTRLEADAPF
jgi:murein DD-endopeptidase MepM/ murein hydrolase activator NlpD